MPSTKSAFDAKVPSPGPHAVLWDMDGTLIDTEPYWIAAEMELVKSHGGNWSEEQAFNLVGQALPNGAKILQEAGVDLGVREIIDHLSGQVVAGLTSDVPWRPGALELLSALHREGIPQALVTMSERSIVHELMAALPEGIFTASVTGEEVTHGKPDPEPYRRGLALLGERLGRRFDPARCIGFEDSKPGITSAAAAGLHAVLIPNATDPGVGNWRRIDTLVDINLKTMTDWLVQVNA
ncbi:HAD family hydrolase [Glutamicibacter sp. AOP12-B1-11]|uniref:HAD family hydrolase n=1 Tax=Glutamicibacter sp. AOP12-B1-11 TaxID=3457725 RepID=UPI0040348EBC